MAARTRAVNEAVGNASGVRCGRLIRVDAEQLAMVGRGAVVG